MTEYTDKEKKLLEASENVDNFRAFLWGFFMISILLSSLYGTYCIGYQEGKRSLVQPFNKLVDCLVKENTNASILKCRAEFNKETKS